MGGFVMTSSLPSQKYYCNNLSKIPHPAMENFALIAQDRALIFLSEIFKTGY
jgi:hypothetical protein